MIKKLGIIYGGIEMYKKIIAVLFIVAFAFSSLAGCGSSGGGGKDVEFTVAHATWVGYAPLYIAKEKGFFEKYGVNPTLTVIEDESQYATALYSNSIQGLGNVLDREVIHYAKGTPEVFVFAMDESSGGDGIIAKKEITSVEDLKGATIGLDKSSTSYFFFLTVLERYGLDESDVIIQEMGAGDAGAAFVAGKLDAAVSWEPWLSNASEREGGHVLVSSKDFPNTIVDVVTMREDFVKKYPNIVTGFTKAWFDAIDFYRENPDEGNEIMAAALGLDKQEIEEMASGVSFFGKEENKVFFDRNNENNIYELAERAGGFWTEKGIIDKNIDTDKLITDKFIKEALK
jgi:NitT/TauT family transport system substrate-binding protein